MIVSSRQGLGATNSQLISSGTSAAAGGIIAGLFASGAITGGVGAVIGAAVAGVTALISVLGIGNGCGQSCILTSNDANQAEAAMATNAQAAQTQLVSNGGCLTQAEQTQLLANFDNLWSALVNACNQVGGTPGANCISQRQRGGEYDYFAAHRDPISAMPVCTGVTGTLNSVTGELSNLVGTSINPTMVAIVGAIALVGLIFSGKD